VAAETALWLQAQDEATSFLWLTAVEAGADLADQLGQRAAILPVIVFLVVGLILLLIVDKARARQNRNGSIT
jgi:MFS-type transporter involved in bile tolerance (Atg22 family)